MFTYPTFGVSRFIVAVASTVDSMFAILAIDSAYYSSECDRSTVRRRAL